MAVTAATIVLTAVANVSSAVRGFKLLGTENNNLSRDFRKNIAAQRQLGNATDATTRSINAQTGAVGRATGANHGHAGSLKSLSREQMFLSSAWKEGSNIVDRRYLRSIGGLREAMYRFNQEAKKTIVNNRGVLTTLDDAAFASERFRMKGNLLVRTLDNMGRNFVNMGKNAQWTGRQLMVGITAPVVALGAMAVKTAVDVEKLDIALQKAAGNIDTNGLAQLDRQTRALSETFGIARTELKAVQTEFARVGFDVGEIERATLAVQQLVAVGDVDITDAQELVRVLRQQGLEWDVIQDQLEKFNVIDDRTNLALKETIASLKDVLPTATRFGNSASEIAAMMAGITEAGLDSGEAARSLNMGLVKIPTALANMASGASGGVARLKNLQQQLEQLNQLSGMNLSLFEDDGTTLRKGTDLIIGFSAAIGELQRTGGAQGEIAAIQALQAAFTTEGQTEGSALVAAINRAITEGSGDFATAMGIARQEIGATAAEWTRQLGVVQDSEATQVGAQMQKMINSAQDLGKKLLPVAVNLLEIINKVVDKFMNLPESAQKAIGIFIAGLATLGPVIYVAAQGMIAFGTVFRGLLIPLRDFFKIRGRFEDIFEGSEETAEEIHRINQEFSRTGDRNKFIESMEGVLASTKEQKAATELASIATEADAAAHAQNTAAINAEAAAQERLNASRTPAQTRMAGLQNHFRRTATADVASILPGAFGGNDMDLDADIEARVISQKSRGIFEDMVSGETARTANPDRILQGLLTSFAGGGASFAPQGHARSAEAFSKLDLEDLANRRAELQTGINTTTEAAIIERAQREIAELEEVERRVRSFESTFGRAAPASTVDEFIDFEQRVKAAIDSNPTLLPGIRSGNRELIHDLFEDVRRSQGEDLFGALGMQTGTIPAYGGRERKSNTIGESGGVKSALAHLADIRDRRAGDVPLPITPELMEELWVSLMEGPDLEHVDHREKSIAETLQKSFDRIRGEGVEGSRRYENEGPAFGPDYDPSTGGYTSRTGTGKNKKKWKGGLGATFGTYAKQAWDRTIQQFPDIDMDDAEQAAIMERMTTDASEEYAKKMRQLRSKYSKDITELKRVGRKGAARLAKDADKLARLEARMRQEATKAANQYLDGISRSSIDGYRQAVRGQTPRGAGGPLDEGKFVASSRRSGFSKEEGGHLVRFLGDKAAVAEGELDELFETMGVGAGTLSDQHLPDVKEGTLQNMSRSDRTAALMAERRRRLMDSVQRSLAGSFDAADIRKTAQLTGLTPAYKQAIAAALWGRADDAEVTSILKTVMGDAFTEQDTAMALAISAALNDGIQGARPVDTANLAGRARGANLVPDSVLTPRMSSAPTMLREQTDDNVMSDMLENARFEATETEGRISEAQDELASLNRDYERIGRERNALDEAFQFNRLGPQLGLTAQEAQAKAEALNARLSGNPRLSYLKIVEEGARAEAEITRGSLNSLKSRRDYLVKSEADIQAMLAESSGMTAGQQRGALAKYLDADAETARLPLDDLIIMADDERIARTQELDDLYDEIARASADMDAQDAKVRKAEGAVRQQRGRIVGRDKKYMPLLDAQHESGVTPEHYGERRETLSSRLTDVDRVRSEKEEEVRALRGRRQAAASTAQRLASSLFNDDDVTALRSVVGHGGPANLANMVGSLSEPMAELVTESYLSGTNIRGVGRLVEDRLGELDPKQKDEISRLVHQISTAMEANGTEVRRLFGDELADERGRIAEANARRVAELPGERPTVDTLGQRSEKSATDRASQARAVGESSVIPGDLPFDDSDFTVQRLDLAEDKFRQTSRVRDELLTEIEGLQFDVVEAEKDRNKKLADAKRKAYAQLTDEYDRAERLAREAEDELEGLRRRLPEGPVVVTSPDGTNTLFNSWDEYESTRRLEAEQIARDTTDLKRITNEERKKIIDQLEFDRKARQEVEDKIAELQAAEVASRSDRDSGRINRNASIASGIFGQSRRTQMSAAEMAALDAMHTLDVDRGGAARTYGRRDIQEYQRRQGMANLFSTITNQPALDVDMGEARQSRGGDRRSRGRRARGAPGAAFGAVREGLQSAIKFGDGKATKGTLLSAAGWLTPLKPMGMFAEKLGGLGGLFGKTFAEGGKGASMLSALFPTMGGSISSVLSFLGPLLPILLAIGAVVAVLALNFKKWIDWARPGLEKLKEAGKNLINAVMDPLRGLFEKLADDGEGMGNMWENIGRIIGKVAEWLAKAFDMLVPIISVVFEVIAGFVYNFIQTFRFFIALLTGDWSDAGDALLEIWDTVWHMIKVIAGNAVKAVLSIFMDMIQALLAAIQTLIPSSIDVLGVEIDIPGLEQLDQFVSDMRDTADTLGNAASDNIDSWIGDGFTEAGREARERGEETGEIFGDGVNDAPPGEFPVPDDTAARESAQDAVSSFLSAFQNQLRKLVDGWKDAALDAFDDWAEASVRAVDERIQAIDREVKAEKERDQDLEYLRKKEELRNKRRSSFVKYHADRDLAVFEGRYDDAKQLDYDYGQTLAEIQREEQDLEDERQRTLTDRMRDGMRERLELEKQELEKSNSIKREQLQTQLDMLTEYIPKNVAEAERMQQEIQAMMESYTGGYGRIGGEQAANWGASWSSAFAAAKRQVAEEAYWAGQEAMENFATALGLDPSLMTTAPPPPPDNFVVGPGVLDADHWQLARPGDVFHSGGQVGGLGTPQDVPATLQTGEYVVRRSAVAKLGADFLDQINNGERPVFHAGGMVGMAGDAMSKQMNVGLAGWRAGTNSLRLGGVNFTAEHYRNALQNAMMGHYGAVIGGGGTPGRINTSGMSLADIVDTVVQGIHPELERRFHAWNAVVGNRYGIGSSYRTMAQQQVLYNRYQAGVAGQAPAARPGSSMHNFGLAIDLTRHTNAADRAAGAAFGLRWPMSYEPWHVEPVEAKEWKEMIIQGFLPGASNLLDTGGLALRAGLLGGQTMSGGTTAGVLGGQDAGLDAPTDVIKGIIRGMLPEFGWGDSEWPSLEKLVQGESGWNPRADNPTSSAAGLFQKLTNLHGPLEQTIRGQGGWGLNYIKGRRDYGTPTAAYSKWLTRWPHWYHQGGLVFPSMDVGGSVMEDGIAKVHAGETVLTRGLTDLVGKLVNNGATGGDHIDIDINLHGFMGSQKELEKLHDMIETKVVPKVQRARGTENRKIGSVTK